MSAFLVWLVGVAVMVVGAYLGSMPLRRAIDRQRAAGEDTYYLNRWLMIVCGLVAVGATILAAGLI